MNDLAQRIRDYVQFERVDEHRDLVKRLIVENNEVELEKLFRRRLTFGTAGLRGRMGPGYSQMNDLVIIQTSQGLVSYLIECHGIQKCKERGVVIGFDARHNSERFARLAALAFLNKEIRVYFSQHMIPTPLIAFGVTHLKCLCGIVVTASHNPKEDNGYKVYWWNGAQILAPHDKNIQSHIEEPENQQPWEGAWSHDRLSSRNLQHRVDPDNPPQNMTTFSTEFPELMVPCFSALFKGYMAYIEHIIGDQREQNQSAGISITYTTMHGVGDMFLTNVLELANFRDTFPVAAQKNPDPNFSTVKFPNPEEPGALDLAFETAFHANSNLILANDPDADRCAAALYDVETQSRRILTGNEIGAILGWWIWFSYQKSLNSHQTSSLLPLQFEDQAKDQSVRGTPIEPKPSKPEDCYMLSTAVSSRFLQSMARVEGFKFIETLTGFKYMGNVAYDLIHNQKKKVLFAYEEAIGYMVDSQILDKDGISAALQLAQCAAYLKNTFDRTLDAHLDWLFARYGYHYSINSYFICREPRTIGQIFHSLQSDYPRSFGSSDNPDEFKITRIRDLNNGFDNGSPGNKATLPTSASSFMVTFFIGTEIQFTIRTSGTEPKVKYYSEIVAQSISDEDAKLEVQQKLRRFVDLAVERCLRPSYFKLEACEAQLN